MTKDEELAFDLALEALEETLKTLDDANAIPGGPIADTIWYSPYETLFDYLEVRIAAIKQARSAPVQEPVAWKDLIYGNLHHQDFGNSIPLYSTPPAAQRQWVGLTDDDIAETDWHLSADREYEQWTLQEQLVVCGVKDFARAIEAKLKEKNT